jgi:hypothetical protein
MNLSNIYAINRLVAEKIVMPEPVKHILILSPTSESNDDCKQLLDACSKKDLNWTLIPNGNGVYYTTQGYESSVAYAIMYNICFNNTYKVAYTIVKPVFHCEITFK